jgi:dihydropteroate synthase
MDAINLPVDPEFSSKTGDIVETVCDRLEDRVECALADGVASDQLILDPGIGFATEDEEDIELIARTAELAELGYPILVGASRKSFTTELVELPPSDRVAPSLAAHLVAAENGADIVRVHDVAPTVYALRTAEAMWEHRTSD